MKFNELLKENKKQVAEAPMGFLKTMGNKVASTFGSGKATGRLETGKEANQLKKDFDVYLGKTGQQATGDLVIQFLKQKGYPTKSAEGLLGGELTANVRAKAAPAQPQTAPTAQEPAAQQTQPAHPSKDEIAKRVKANVGKSAAATKASGFGQQPAPQQPAPGPSAMAQFVKQQTGDNPITMKPAPQKAPAAQPAATQPAAQVPVRPQGGGKVAGTVSQTPGAIKKRQARAFKKRTTHPADDNPNIQLGTESVEYAFESRVNYYLMLAEALSSKQIDAVFLAAVQEKQRAGGSAQPAAKAAPAGEEPAATVSQPEQPARAPAGGAGSQFLKHAAAAYDGMRGASFGATKLGQEEPGKEIKDRSGRVPANIMSQINQLSNKQRAQLRRELDKA